MNVTRYTIVSSLALLLSLVSHAHAEDERGAAAAGRCSHLLECPTFDQVYKNTPALRHALADAFRHAQQKQPEWLTDGAASAVVPVIVGGRTYLLGNVSDTNDLKHRVSVLYDLIKGSVTAQYLDPDGNVAILGDESQLLSNVVANYQEESSGLFKAARDPKSPLPIQVDPGSS